MVDSGQQENTTKSRKRKYYKNKNDNIKLLDYFLATNPRALCGYEIIFYKVSFTSLWERTHSIFPAIATIQALSMLSCGCKQISVYLAGRDLFHRESYADKFKYFRCKNHRKDRGGEYITAYPLHIRSIQPSETLDTLLGPSVD